MKIAFLGEGPRDHAIIPKIVEKLLDQGIDASFLEWAGVELRLHGGGIERKLLIALLNAQRDSRDALVATIDADKTKKDRLAAMIDGRALHREKHPSLPTALGCAEPHAEAWLLDDPVAVRTALGLPAATAIPNVRDTKVPKKTLDQLIESSPREGVDHMVFLTEIAAAVEPDRCAHRKETGFARFQKDVEAELRDTATAR